MIVIFGPSYRSKSKVSGVMLLCLTWLGCDLQPVFCRGPSGADAVSKVWKEANLR